MYNCFGREGDINVIFKTVFGSDELNKIGKNLVLFDSCCSGPVTNQSPLMNYIEPNRKPKTQTLGGEYQPPETGFSDLFGPVDFDPPIGMTVLSQRQLELQGCGVTRLGDVYTYNTLIARVPDIDGMPALFADESDDENDTDDHVREQNLSRSRE